jgi:hypothetical protein
MDSQVGQLPNVVAAVIVCLNVFLLYETFVG